MYAILKGGNGGLILHENLLFGDKQFFNLVLVHLEFRVWSIKPAQVEFLTLEIVF